jgi:hypothetical protein
VNYIIKVIGINKTARKTKTIASLLARRSKARLAGKTFEDRKCSKRGHQRHLEGI